MKLYPALLLLSFPLVYCSCHNDVKKTEAVIPREERKFDHFLDSLKKANSSELNTANQIRHYLARRIDLGVSKDSLAFNYHKIPWDDFPAFHCIELFEEDRLTANCGLTSYVLANLYNHAGYESFIYDCGFDNTKLTHEFVLLKFNDKLIVQDAFFDITITDPENNPKDFLQLLSEIEAGDFSGIHVVQENVLSESWLNSQSELDSLLETHEDYSEFFKKYVKEVTSEDHRLRILVERNFNSFTTPTLERMKLLLKADSLPENFLSIYLKPLGVKNGTSGKEEESLEKLINSVVMN